MPSMKLPRMIDALARAHGEPARPPVTGPFEMILWENVAYLADDPKRSRAFETLRAGVGLEPAAILAAPDEALMAATSAGGIHADLRMEKLRDAARMALDGHDGDLRPVLALPPARAVRTLARFPGIGAPGAEKILMSCGAQPILALESNGLRVLQRIGYGKQEKSYAATYRSVRDRAAAEMPEDPAALTRAHHLLREHGRRICRRTTPACEACPISRSCLFFKTHTR